MTADKEVRCLKWVDKRDVHIIFTYHSDDVIEKCRISRAVAGVETIKKPRMIEDYNKNMNGADQNDRNPRQVIRIEYHGVNRNKNIQ